MRSTKRSKSCLYLSCSGVGQGPGGKDGAEGLSPTRLGDLGACTPCNQGFWHSGHSWEAYSVGTFSMGLGETGGFDSLARFPSTVSFAPILFHSSDGPISHFRSLLFSFMILI